MLIDSLIAGGDRPNIMDSLQTRLKVLADRKVSSGRFGQPPEVI
jgi:hypothetical protein